MTDKMTVQKLAGEFQRAYKKGKNEFDHAVDSGAAKYGAELAMAAIQLYRARVEFDAGEARSDYESENALVAQWRHKLLDGLPEGTTLEQAVRIKAAEGDPLAKRILAEQNSPEIRTSTALFVAAVSLHPGWQDLGDGEYHRDKNAPEPDELIEWLYKHYPKVARQIEDDNA